MSSSKDKEDKNNEDSNAADNNDRDAKAVLLATGLLSFDHHEARMPEGTVDANNETASANQKFKISDEEEEEEDTKSTLRVQQEKQDITDKPNAAAFAPGVLSPSEFNAEDIPITTELRRQDARANARPGAFRQAGMQANTSSDSNRRYSLTGGGDNMLGEQPPAPLLTATLVQQFDDDDDEENPPPANLTAPVVSGIIAKAEPIEHAQEKGDLSASALINNNNNNNHKRIYAVICIAVLACIIVGLVTGVVVSNTDNGDDSSRNQPVPPPPVQDPSSDSADSDEANARQVYYLVQWALGTVGGGTSAYDFNLPVEIQCSGQGELQVIDRFNANSTICDPVVNDPSFQRCFSNGLPSPWGSNGKYDEQSRPSNGQPPHDGQRKLQNTVIHLTDPVIFVAAALVSCAGSNDNDLVLTTSVEIQRSPEFDFLFLEQDLGNGTVRQVHGGGMATFLSSHVLCRDEEEEQVFFVSFPCLKGIRDVMSNVDVCHDSTECATPTESSCTLRPRKLDATLVPASLAGRCGISMNDARSNGDPWEVDTLWEYAQQYLIQESQVAIFVNKTIDDLFFLLDNYF